MKEGKVKKMKNKRYLIDLADHMGDICESQAHILSGKFTDQNEVEQVISVLDDNMFKSYFEYFFYSYSMITYKELTDDNIITRFNDMWRIFQFEEKENLNKIIQAYYWDYVPVYNYDRTEVWTDIRSGNETDARKLDYALKESNTKTTGSFKDEMTPTGERINTKTTSGGYTDTLDYDDDITKEDVSTMDSANYRAKSKITEDSHTDTNEREYNDLQDQTIESFDTYKETNERTYNNHNIQVKENAHLDKDDNTHTYNDVTDAHEGHMFGNIGVTTNMDMIQQEFEGRVHELGYEFMKKFFDKYFIML